MENYEELKTTNQELYKAFIEFFNDEKEYLDEYGLFDDTEVEISKFYDGSYKIYIGHSDAGMNTFYEDLFDVENWYDSENIEYPLGNGFGYFADFNIDSERNFIEKEDVYNLINQTDFKESSNSLSLSNWSIKTYKDSKSYYCGLVYKNQLDYTSLFKIEAEEFNNFNNNIHNKEIFDYLYHLLGIDDYLIEVEKE